MKAADGQGKSEGMSRPPKSLDFILPLVGRHCDFKPRFVLNESMVSNPSIHPKADSGGFGDWGMRDSGSRFFEQETVWSFKKHGSDICDRGLDALPHSSSLICKMMELEQVISRISCHSPRSELQDKTSMSKYSLRASSPGSQGTVSFL